MFYSCCNNYHELSVLKQNKFVILLIWVSEFQNVLKITVLAGLPSFWGLSERICFLDFSGGCPHSVACGSVSPASNLAVTG